MLAPLFERNTRLIFTASHRSLYLRGVLLAVLVFVFGGAATAQQSTVAFSENFQSYGKSKKPAGWIDTKVGSLNAKPRGYFKTRIDPTQDKNGANIVYGTLKSTGHHDDQTDPDDDDANTNTNKPKRDGYFAIYQPKVFSASGRFEVTGRLIRVGDRTRAGLTVLSGYPEKDKYYLINEEVAKGATLPTLRLSSFGAGTPSGVIDSKVTLTPGKWYRFKLATDSVGGTTFIRARFWLEGTTEPSTFQIEATDSSASRLTAGRFGMWTGGGDPDDDNSDKGDDESAPPKKGAYIDDLNAKSPADVGLPTISFFESGNPLSTTTRTDFGRNVAVEIRVADELSTVTHTATINGAPYKSLDPITTEGTHVIKARAIDAVGNVAESEVRILVDKTGPVITLLESGQPLADNTKFMRPAAVEIVVADALSSSTSVAKLDGNLYTSLTSIGTEGPHVLLVEAVDAVGNKTPRQVRLVIDLTRPVITFLESGNVVNSTNAKFKFNPSIEIKTVDALPVDLKATLNGAPYDSLTPITVDGHHQIVATATDDAGNVATATLDVLIDKVAPVVDLLESSQTLDVTRIATFARDASIEIKVNDATSTVEWAAKLDNATYNSGTLITAEGTHTLTVRATDETGNFTDVTLSILIDKTKPEVSFFETGVKLDPRADNLFRKDVAIEIKAFDAASDATFSATLDGAKYESLTPITAEGVHVIGVHAVDTAGNFLDVELRFVIDKTRPVIVLTEGDAPLAPGSEKALPRDARVVITVTDNQPGVAHTAKLDGSDYTSDAVISAEGPHTLTVHAVDAAGNEAESTVTLLIDKSGPTIAFFESNVELLQTEPKHKFKVRPAIEIRIADTYSQVNREIKLDGVEYTPLTPIAEGIHTLTVHAVDVLGNPTDASIALLVDLTAPRVVLKEGTNVLPLTGGIFARDLTISPDIQDLSATEVEATLDGAPFPLTTPVASEQPVPHTLTITVTDELGWSTPVTATFTIDKTAPKVTVREGTAPLLDNDSFARDVTINATAEDATPVTYEATLDGQHYNLGTLITADGTHTIVVTGIDAAGNRSEPQTIRFHIERANPEVKLFESGQRFPADKSFNRDIVATIEVVAATAWTSVAKIDGVEYTLGTPYTVEGKHELTVVVTTAAQRSTPASVEFEIDKTRPTIRLMANGAAMTNDQTFSADFTPSTEADDNLTKPPVVVVTLDGQILAPTTVVSEEKVHTIVATATDRAGNTETSGPFTFVLDKTDPTVTVNVDGKPLVNGDQFKTAITPEIKAEDLTPTTISATLDGVKYEPETPIVEDGSHTLVVKATDRLNHETPLPPITFVIDKTAPVVTVLEAGAPFVSGSKYRRGVKPEIKVVDTTKTEITATLDGNVYTLDSEITSEGHHELAGVVTDELGWVTPIPTIRFTIDNTAPDVEVREGANLLANNTIFNRDVQPTIVVTDATTTIIDVTLDGVKFESGTLVTTEGAHTLVGKVTDELGLFTPIQPIAFTIDKTAPVVVITEAGIPFLDNALLNHDAVPQATITDITAVTITAKLDGADYTLGTPITTEGPHTLVWSARDAAGWTTPDATIRFVIDKTAPEVKITDGGVELVSGLEVGRSVVPVITVTDISATNIDARLDGVLFQSGTEVAAEGTHTLNVTVTDAAGWVKIVPPITFLIDKTKPNVRVLESGQELVSGTKFSRGVLPQIVITDNTATTIAAKLGDAEYTPDTLIETEGLLTLSISVTDRGGNTTIVPPISFTIDRTPPVVTITESGQPLTTGKAFMRAVKPEIAIQDITQTTIAAELNDQQFTFGTELTEERRYSLNVTVTDELGWSHTVPTIAFAIDKTAPKVELVEDGKPFVDGAIFNRAVEPKAIIDDVTETTVSATLNGAEYKLGDKIEAEGEYTLTVRVTDAVGLFTDAPTVKFRIDLTRPVISFITPANQQTLTDARVLVTGNADDSMKVEVSGVEAEIDLTTKRFTVPSLELLEGPNTIVAIGTDAAGNVSDPVSVDVTVDTRAPEVDIASPETDACVTTRELAVSGTVSDPQVASVRVAILPGTTAPVEATLSADRRSWSANVIFPSEGKFVLSATARDNSGHESVSTVQVRVDQTKPRIEITESGAPFNAPFVNRTVMPFVRAIDADATTKLTVTLDGVAYVSGTPIANERAEAYELKATATDCAGNKSDDVVIRFVIDTTPPVFITLSPANGASIGSSVGTGPAITGTVSPDTVSVLVEDTGAPANVANGAFTFGALPTADGVNRFTLVAIDRAGNRTRLDYSFTLKTTTPTVEITENGSAIVSGTKYIREVVVDVRSNEADAIITATHNGAAFTSGTTISANGSHTIHASARDAFGHTSQPKEVTFTIDRDRPVVTITEPVDGANVSTSTVRVRGSVSGDPVSATINGAILTLTNGAFDTEVALEMGVNQITVMALDAAGNAGSASVDVTRGGGTLGIILNSPVGGLPTNRRTTVVAGQVLTPAGVDHVTVNGVEVPIDAAGAFRKTDFPLNEGQNVITATVRKGGAEGSVSVTVTADFTPPAIVVTESGNALDDEARFASRADITVVATDNGQSVTPTLLVDAANATSPVSVTTTGGHTLVAVARDLAGNENRVERTFFIGGSSTAGGCALTDFDPATGALVTSPTVTLVGRTGGAIGVKVNGTAAIVSNGSFSATVNLPNEGENTITITCTDANGNATGEPEITKLIRATGAPSVNITTPDDNSVHPTETITVTGTIGGAASEVLVNGVAATINGNTFTASNVRLSGGVNVIVARAKNTAGRTAADSIRVTWLKNAPGITITSPASALTVRTPTLDISGVWANLDPASITVSNVAAQSTITSDTTGTFSAPSVPLNVGLQTILVRGTDRLGRAATASIAVTRADGKPSITINSPIDNATYNSTAPETFTVTGAFSADAGATVEVNGQPATFAQSGNEQATTFTATVPFASLALGLTPVIARVTEPDGTFAIDTVRVSKYGVAPMVVQTFPEADAVNVDAGTLPLVLFSAPMDRASTRAAFRLENAAGTAVSGDITIDKDVLTFAPAALLEAGERYTMRVAATAADLAGNAIGTAFSRSFTVAATAPAAAPSVTVSPTRACDYVDLTGTAIPNARVRIDLGSLTFNVTASSTGAFTFRLPLSGRTGFQVARVRIVGSDASLSPAAEATFEVDCSGPQVTNATYDRTSNVLTVSFSRAIDIATITTGANGSARLQLDNGTIVSGTVAALASPSSVSITPAQNLTAESFTLTITTAVKDTNGTNLTAPFARSFNTGEPQLGDGAGYIAGEIFDADTGRPLAAATVTVDLPGGAMSAVAGNRGRYLRELPEGAHTIRASADGYTTVWRQIIVRAGAGVIPTDIRLTRRGTQKNGDGAALVLTHMQPLALPADLRIPAGVVAAGKNVTLTTLGAQSLAGLLPLGWSPLASAEIVSNAPALSGAELTFTVPAADITAATQTLTAVRYFDDRDEWRVVSAVVSLNGDKATIPVAAAGAYALVYADKGPRLEAPPVPTSGSVLSGVIDPCINATTPCPPLAAKETLKLDPPVVLPSQRTVATLRIEGANASIFPSGTAVQAYVDEELRLADGTRDVVAPFATDLLLYRTLTGDVAEAEFHLAPSARASEVVLEVGYDHIRILPYPERLDRGTLIGQEGGRVPADDRVSIDIPAGATAEPLRANATSITDFAPFGTIPGYSIVGGVTLSLQWGGAQNEESTPPELLKPARATFTVNASTQPSQLILVEVLEGTQYGRVFRLASQMTALEGTGRYSTKNIDRALLPVDGIIRDGRYLLLAPDAPIAFATGTVHIGTGGAATANARVLTPSLGVVDITRITGIFNVPVPAAAFSLIPRTPATGDGATYTHPSAVAADAIVNVGALAIVAQPPTVALTVLAHQGTGTSITEVSADGATGVTTNTSVKALFSPGLDPQSVRTDSLVVIDDGDASVVKGRAVAQGSTGILWTLEPGARLRADGKYTAVVSPNVRGMNGTPLGTPRPASFSTVSTLSSPEVDPTKIRITMPDANGRAQIIGAPGALAEGYNAVAVRRGVDFSNRPQDTANSQKAFLIRLGEDNDPNNRVTIADEIYLQIINHAGAVSAIVQLGPFTTEDGRGFVARAEKETKYTTPDHVTITVPSGAFDAPTMVTTQPAPQSAVAEVPGIDEELGFLAGFKIDFEGIAKKRLDIMFPTPASLPAGKNAYLGMHGMSSRGPRIMMIDLLRRDGANLTTVHPDTSGARGIGAESLSGRGVSADAIVNPTVLRDMLLGIDRGSIIIGFTFQTAVNFITFAPPPVPLDFFIPPIKSLYYASFAVERDRLLVPIPADRPFRVIGVDPGSGMTVIDAPYDARLPGEPGDAIPVTLPSTNDIGPYPVFASPGRVEILDLNSDSIEDESVRNLVVKFDGSSVELKNATSALAANTRVEVLNLRSAAVSRWDDFASVGASGVTFPAQVGDRLIFLVGEKDIDASSVLTVVFSEPVTVGTQDQLRAQFKLLVADPAVVPLSFKPLTAFAEIKTDSGGRRVSIVQRGGFQRGKHYRLVLGGDIKDRDTTNPLFLGQKATGAAPGALTLDFVTRSPKGVLGSFDIPEGGVRDLAMSGNVLLVSALEGGILAYDASNPAALSGSASPAPMAKVNPPPGSTSQNWALATDDHGRVFATAVSPMYGVLRSYRIEDFYCVAGSGTTCPAEPQQKGNAIIAWRTGINVGMPLASMVIGGWPEAIPRKLQVVTKDAEPEIITFEPDPPPAIPGGPIPGALGNGFRSMQIEVTPSSLLYDKQRVTVINTTRNFRWSKDISTTGGATTFDVIGRAGDEIRVVKNLTTLGVVSLFGHGVGVYDINAVDANYRHVLDSSWERMMDVLVLDTGDGGSCGINASCDIPGEATLGRQCPIADLAFTPDAAMVANFSGSGFGTFALEQNRGLVQLNMAAQTPDPADPSSSTVSCNRSGSLVFAERVIIPGQGRRWSAHPRLNQLRRLFRDGTGRDPSARYTSIAPYQHANGNKYLLVAGNEFGLLVTKAGNSLDRSSLVDVVWIPSGANSVRVMQDANLAVVVDGIGRVLLINLGQIDSMPMPAAAPNCSALDCEWPLFPIPLAALSPVPPPAGSPAGTPPTPIPNGPDGIGFDDPRIVWKSAPGMVTGTLPPIVDAETGFVYTGDVLGQKMNVVSAVDPRARFVGRNTASAVPFGELDRIVPLGVEGPAVPAGTIAPAPGTLAAFQVQLSIPGGVTEALSQPVLHMALESERVLGSANSQSPAFLPRAHLRQTSRTGKKDSRSTVFALQHDVPTSGPGLGNLRFQRGWNRMVSKWIVAIADPRASKDYEWGATLTAQQKADRGCYSCERPSFITGTLGTDWFELYTAGRVIAVRPERCATPSPAGCAPTDVSIFQGTDYAYLGDAHRLESRIATVMADTVRPTHVLSAAQGAPAAIGAHQETFLVHSGEVMSRTVDLDAGGRVGWNVVFDRTYRSRTLGLSPLGAGWDASYLQRLRPLPNLSVEYRDGSGETWRFTPATGGGYNAPPALNLKLVRRNEGWRMTDVKQRITDFDELGRITMRSDEFFKIGVANTGNAIHYSYDADGRLARITDPVGRATTVDYEGDSDQVSVIEDWRDREIKFHVNPAGVLTQVELPKTRGADLVYDHSSDSSRPKQNYTYFSSSSAYSDQLELGTNLATIREPGDLEARVTFEYEPSGNVRDMIKNEKWGTLDNAVSTFAYTLASDLPVSVETIVHDAMQQKRTYTISGALAPTNYTDDRVHVDKIVEAGVPVWEVAEFGALPTSVSYATYGNTNVDRTWRFEYSNGRPHVTKLMKPGSSTEPLVTSTIGFASISGIGSVPASRSITSISGIAGMSQTFDHGGDAFLDNVSSDAGSVQAPEAHRDTLVPAATDGGVERKNTFNAQGQLKKVESSATAAPATGPGAVGEIDYHPSNDSIRHRRGMPSAFKEGAGGSVRTDVIYDPLNPDMVTFDRAGRSYTTRQQLDERGRIIRTTVTGTDVDSEDVYGYDARGRLRIHRRKQGTKVIEERYRYDLVDRLLEHETWEGLGSPSTRKQKTEYTYNLPAHVLRKILPEGGEITTTIDKLGRMQDRVTDPKNPAFMGIVTTMTERKRYDVHGNVVYESDDIHASATRYDAAHRAVETLLDDGSHLTSAYDGFGRLTTFSDPEKNFSMSNVFTSGGKLQSTTINGGAAQQHTWDGAGRTSMTITTAGAGAPAQMERADYDDAGRLLNTRFGEALGSTMVRTFEQTTFTYGGSDLPSQATTAENNGASSYSSMLEHDAFGRTTKIAPPAAADMTIERDFDQAGNVTRVKAPDMAGDVTFDYDARSRMTLKQLPGGGANQYVYDENGAFHKYIDPLSEPTTTENDGVGRPFRRTYADGSTEELHYELWRLKKVKDRQNRWLHYNYDSEGRIELVTNGAGVEVDRMVYDAQGRLIRWRTPDSLIELFNFDSVGRPQLTRQTRYRNGSPIDDYQQSHSYDAMGRRTTWTMPGTSALAGQPWTTSVTQRYDAVGNLIGIDRAVANGAGTGPLLTSEYRTMKRPIHRTLNVGAGTAGASEIRREYGYESAAGRMNLFKVFAGSQLMAGSEIIFEGTLRKSATLLGLANGGLTTTWDYDDRGRLIGSSAATSTPGAASVPAASQTVTPRMTPADFLYEIQRSAGTTSTFTETPLGHKIAYAGNPAEPYEYKKADGSDGGGVRTGDGQFLYEFDEKQRLRTVTERLSAGDTRVIRVVYSYSGADRMIGRRVEIADVAGGTMPPDSAFVLAKPEELGPDAGIPASTTFVWDPISDQLVAVFEAEKYAAGAVVPSGRLIRQYIHGGMSLDDPIEVTVAEDDGVHRYYPIYDEAGDGGLQAILNESGRIVARTIISDPYGDGEVVLPGPAVEKLTVGRGTGTPAGVYVDLEFTEPIDAATLADGMRLSSLNTGGTTIFTSTVVPGLVGDGRLVRWDLTPAQWAELANAPNARALSVSVTAALRSSTYTHGAAVLPANTTLRSGVFTTPEVPFELHEAFNGVNERLAANSSYLLYELTTLTGMGSSSGSSARSGRGISTEAVQTADSGALLLLTASFQAQSFTDPFTLKNYVRARWYDPPSGTFLSPDPRGYQDSANLYAFAAGDPVNHRDPTGEAVWVVYREFNGRGLRLAYPIIGHYYLAFDATGLADPVCWAQLVNTQPLQTGGSLLRLPNPDGETFSFHPRGVRSDDDGTGAVASTFVTRGSYIGYNDKFDQESFWEARTNHLQNREMGRQRIWKITDEQEAQERLYLMAVRQRQEMNERRRDVFGSYYLMHNNCGTWAQEMVERAGLTWPSEATKYNAGGAGIGGIQDYLGLSTIVTGIAAASGFTWEFLKTGEYFLELQPDHSGMQCEAPAIVGGYRIRF